MVAPSWLSSELGRSLWFDQHTTLTTIWITARKPKPTLPVTQLYITRKRSSAGCGNSTPTPSKKYSDFADWGLWEIRSACGDRLRANPFSVWR